MTLHLRPGTIIQPGGRPATLPLETSDTLSFATAGGETMLLLPPYAYEQGRPEVVAVGRYAAGGHRRHSGARLCTITAHQPGDAAYNPAPNVARTFQVTAAPAAPPTWSLYLPFVAR